MTTILDTRFIVDHYQIGMTVEHDLYGYGTVRWIRPGPGTPGIGVEFPRDVNRAFYPGSGRLLLDVTTQLVLQGASGMRIERLLPSKLSTGEAYPVVLEASDDLFDRVGHGPLALLIESIRWGGADAVAVIGSRSRLSATVNGPAFAIIDGKPMTWVGPVSEKAILAALALGSWDEYVLPRRASDHHRCQPQSLVGPCAGADVTSRPTFRSRRLESRCC